MIKLTNYDDYLDDYQYYLNPNHIIAIISKLEGTLLTLTDNSKLHVKEKADDIAYAINNGLTIEEATNPKEC